MPGRIVVHGLRELQDKIKKVQIACNRAMAEALGLSLALVEDRATAILDKEIYDAPRAPYARELTGTLRDSFVHEIYLVGLGAIGGSVGNTAPEAPFVEFGTGLYGPELAKYFISPVNASALHWIDPFTGADMFSKGHYVSGQLDIHFLELALTQNIVEIRAIFQTQVQKALEAL